MRATKWKYFLAFSLPLITFVSVYVGGIWSYLTVLEAFVLIPVLELLSQPDASGPEDDVQAQLLLADRFYDYVLYAMVPVQYAVIAYFLYRVGQQHLAMYELVGMTLSVGIQCGAIGINVAHELGHRKTPLDRFLARTLLLSSLYMHFIVEHNRGHHKHVATPKDPASARLNEAIYLFWPRTIIGSFRSAWRIECRERTKKGLPTWSIQNEMIRLILIQASMLVLIYVAFGPLALLAFLFAALIGILLLETVNYIEHYGLERRLIGEGRYERVQPWHSWNSDYPIGRIMLFELTRHSDHHYKASKKYQVLTHLPKSPQLPTGYPGMMLLSLVPPLWFKTVNPLIQRISP